MSLRVAAVPERRGLAALLLLLLAALAPAVVAQAAPRVASPDTDEIGYLQGRIQAIFEGDDAKRAHVRLPSGEALDAQLPPPDPYAPEGLPAFEVGDRVELYYSPGPGGERQYVVADWVRHPPLLALGLAFLFVAVVVARWKGLRAVVATAASLGIVVGFVVPRIANGADPVPVVLLGAGGILVFAIYFVHGVSWSTTAALAGTFVAAMVTMGLGVAFTRLTHLTGLGSEDAMLIASAAPDVALRGLLLAGLLVGALGALTDITIVQAAVVRELAHTDPALSFRSLYRGGMNVGKDHVGSLVNTLVLAYTGSALPLLVLLTAGDIGWRHAVNLELIAGEVVHTLVGSIGLILAVPLTTALAAALFRGDRLPLRAGELDHAHSHG